MFVYISLYFLLSICLLEETIFIMFLVFLLTLPPPVLSQNKMEFLVSDNGYFYTGPESTWEHFLAAVAFVIPLSTVQMQGQALDSSPCSPFQSKREIHHKYFFLKEFLDAYVLSTH